MSGIGTSGASVSPLSPDVTEELVGQLRDLDRDRYLALLLMPKDLRGSIAALYCFNAEIARIRELVSDPMPGEIRLQWWRDVLSAAKGSDLPDHPLARALVEVVDAHELPRSSLDRMLEARIFDLYDDPMPDRAAFEGYAGETASTLLQLTALILAPNQATRVADLAGHGGVAQVVAGHLLLLPHTHGRGQIYIPLDILAAVGVDRTRFLQSLESDSIGRAVQAFAAYGQDHLDRARKAADDLPRDIRPAFLPLAFVQLILSRATKRPADHAQFLPSQWRRQLQLMGFQLGRNF